VGATLVIVTGAPGVGKSTLAEELSRELSFVLIAKDDAKEVLFESMGTGDRAWSRRLGTTSFDLMFLFARRVLETTGSCILEANFTRVEPLLTLPAGHVVQFFCTAPRDVVVSRYAARKRHPGHLDAEIAGELAERLDAGEWQPLALPGETIVVDTTAPLDVEALAARVHRA
jgi:predicted kinase